MEVCESAMNVIIGFTAGFIVGRNWVKLKTIKIRRGGNGKK